MGSLRVAMIGFVLPRRHPAGEEVGKMAASMMRTESFLLLFFKKEVLAFLACLYAAWGWMRW